LEQDIPEQYYCEECRPENHSWTKLANGRNKRHYHPDGSAEKKQQPKKRMTNNSREADVPLADILLSRAMVNGEEPASLAKDEKAKVEEEDEQTPPSLLPIVEGIEEAVKRRSRRSVEEAHQAAIAAAAAAATTKRSRSHSTDDEKATEGKGVADNAQEESDTDNKNKRPKRSGPSNNRSDKKLAVTKKPARKPGVKRGVKNARSRTSTPQLSDSESMPPQEKADEPSAPARVRYPSAKMSLWEMNRRAKQILEYISSVQVEMANKPNAFKPKAPEDGSSGHLEVPASPTSSVSSATTLPLDSNTNNEEANGEQTSLAIMDRLTRELIKFQNKFSTSYHHHQAHQQAQRRLHTPDQVSTVASSSNNNSSGNEEITISITAAAATVSHG